MPRAAPSRPPSTTRPTDSARIDRPSGGPKGLLRVNVTAYLTEYNNAGVVREDDYNSGRVGFYGTEDPNQTGNESSRVSVSATYERRFEDIDMSQQLYFIDR